MPEHSAKISRPPGSTAVRGGWDSAGASGRRRFALLRAPSAAPEEGLHYFARLREQHPSFFQRLTLSTIGLRYLIAVFTHSHFLSEEVLEHPEWAEQLLDAGDLHQVLTAD